MSTDETKEKMSIRHILLVVTGIFLTFGCSALVFSTWSLFQAVVPDALGVPKTAFAAYITVLYLTMTVASPIAGKLIQKMDIRIILTGSAVLVGLAFIIIGLVKQLWAFYLGGILMGMGEISILWLAIPTLINRWFNERAGTFVGVCMAFTGIGGAIWAQVFGALYNGGAGLDIWTIYLIWGVIALVTSVPFTTLCIRSTPEECGCKPYGKVQSASGKPEGLDASKAMKMPVFYACFIFAGLINLLTIVAQQFPTYTKQLVGVSFDAMAVGIMMATVMMVAQAICKVALGVVADKNVKVSFVAACVAGIVGVVLVMTGSFNEIVLYAGAAIYGFFFASAAVLMPIVVRQIFGVREYSEIYSRISVFVNLLGAVGAMFWAFIGEAAGFTALFLVAIGLLVVVLLLGLYAFANMKKIRAQWTD